MFGKIINYKVENQKVEIQFEKQVAYVEVLTSQIINFLVPYMSKDHNSKAIEGDKKQQTKVDIKREDDCLCIATSDLKVNIYEEFKVDIYNAKNELLCADYRGDREYKAPISEKSLQQMKAEGHPVSGRSDYNYKFQVVKALQGDEKFYGLGDKTGFLNKRDYEYEMWNTDNPMPQVDNFKVLYKTFPFFITLKRCGVFGIFFDNTFRTFFDMGKEKTDYYFFGADNGNLDYYFIGGNDMLEVLKNHTYLTGTAPVPQLWTLGYHQSRWGYESAEEVMGIAKKYREYQIPCDTIHLDIDYMERFKIFTWDEQEFGKPGQLVNDLKEQGFKTVTIIDPGIKVEDGYDKYEEGIKQGYFVKSPNGEVYENAAWPGKAVFPDFGNPKVQNWWIENTKFLTDMGVAGIWNDMNEPAGFMGEFPDDIVFMDGDRTATHEEMHNVYGHLMSKATYDGLIKHDGRRPFVITRACYSGTQKYSTGWTGDNHSMWAHLQMAIPQLCNMGLSGLVNVGTDVGGFAADTTPELLSRWVQIGCFSPIFRNHCAKWGRYQEPWMFDEKTREINKKYIELRYQLLPYIYDLFHEEEKTGMPIMRPLVLHYEKDEKVWNMNDEFLVGEQMLVAPVIEPGQTARLVYLPEGIWYDYWTKEKWNGGQYIIKEAPVDVCPIYVKAGSIIPNYPIQQYVGEKEIESIILDVYPGEGTYLHYQDNGEDFAYRDGEINIYEITVHGEETSVTLKHHGYDKVYNCAKIKGKGYLDEYKRIHI